MRFNLMIFCTYLIGHSNLYKKIKMNQFSRAVRRENFLYVSKGGLIYPNEPSIESLQLMFGHEEKEEICRKWVFMTR